MTIDLLQPSDLHVALRLSMQAGWNQLAADWERLLALFPQTCFAGRIDGKLIATSTLATYGPSLAWVGMVLVDEAHRGQGFGGKILDAAISAGKQRNIQTIGLDATDLGRPVYLKRGFRDFAGIDRWVREPGPSTARIESAGNLEKAPGDLSAFDRQSANINRADLLNHLMHETGVRISTFRRSGELRAYAMLRRGRTAWHIGPVVGYSEAEASAVTDELLSVQEVASGRILIDVPRGRLASWLPTAGFTVARRLTRMLLGCNDTTLMGPNIFSAVSFEVG